MRRLAALAPIFLALSAASGCARCSAHHDAPDAGPMPPPTLPALLPAPRPWSFARVRTDAGIALPERCRFRAPITRAEVGTLTRFVAEPHALSTLVIADADGSPPRLTGVGALTLDPEGATRDPVALPWFEPNAVPRLAKVGEAWIAALDRAGFDGARVALWQHGGAATIGEGDGFEAVDLACAGGTSAALDGGITSADAGSTSASGARCALLTTRPLKVAAPGATVWIGAPEEAASRWKPIEILPAAADSDAHPLGVAMIDAASTGARVMTALAEKGEVVIHEAGESGAREIARLPAPHGALDVIALPRPVVMAFTSAVDDDGCARDGKPGVRFVREGAAPIDFAMPAPPSHGVLRRLARGAIAAWIAPIGCRQARKVVYAVVLDESGAPAGSPIPVGDASGFALTARGDDVDLWLQDASSVTWVRAGCGPR
ncbi:MAG: hypothetical protein QM820_07620 [Minicystis sp.]